MLGVGAAFAFAMGIESGLQNGFTLWHIPWLFITGVVATVGTFGMMIRVVMFVRERIGFPYYRTEVTTREALKRWFEDNEQID